LPAVILEGSPAVSLAGLPASGVVYPPFFLSAVVVAEWRTCLPFFLSAVLCGGVENLAPMTFFHRRFQLFNSGNNMP
jgi:hypothetical protein